MGYDLSEDLPEDAEELVALMREDVASIHEALSEGVDTGGDLAVAERLLQDGFDRYQDMMRLTGMALSYGNYKAGIQEEYTEPRRELGVESKQVLEYVPLVEAGRAYEETVLRYIGIRDGIEPADYNSLQHFLEEYEDVELPDGLNTDVFHRDAEIVD